MDDGVQPVHDLLIADLDGQLTAAVEASGRQD